MHIKVKFTPVQTAQILSATNLWASVAYRCCIGVNFIQISLSVVNLMCFRTNNMYLHCRNLNNCPPLGLLCGYSGLWLNGYQNISIAVEGAECRNVVCVCNLFIQNTSPERQHLFFIGVLLFSQFYGWANWSTKRSSALPTVTQRIGDSDCNQTRI